MTATTSEPAARAAGARVHFDVDRHGQRAVDVVLRPGTRNSPRQRRFGDLSGTSSPDAKGNAPAVHAQPELGHDLQRHPLRVVERWAALLADGDLDEAMLLYAPGAALHADGDVQVGPAVRRYLAASPLLGGPAPSSIAGEGDLVVVRWPGQTAEASGTDEGSSEGGEGSGAPMESHIHVAHGTIVEQWLGWTWAIVASETGAPEIEISTRGGIGPAARTYALDRIGKALATVDEPVLYASLRLDRASDPARERPALARVTVDIDGQQIRAHVAAATLEESIDLLEARLRHRLEHRAQHLRALRRRGPESPPGEWRHGDLPTERPHHHPRPVEERQIVRHKSFTTTRSTVDEAIFDLESFDADFFLFTDLATGDDAVVSRAAGGAYVLHYRQTPDEVPGPCASVVELDPRPAPTESLDTAREILDGGDEPWVFFTDRDSGRGHVLYRRLDGHYGLITPVDEPDGASGASGASGATAASPAGDATPAVGPQR
jgi:ribosome-associated translation inhibitor RaiA